MQNRELAKPQAEEQDTSGKLLALFMLGFSITILGLILVVVAAALSQSSQASFGGVIFIGPFPIAFGAGPGALWLILFAIILTVLSIIMFLVFRRKVNDAKV
jgi:uncharacterized membrane protein